VIARASQADAAVAIISSADLALPYQVKATAGGAGAELHIAIAFENAYER